MAIHGVVACQWRNEPGTIRNFPSSSRLPGWSRIFMSVVIVAENMSDASTDVGECFLSPNIHSDPPALDAGFPQVGGTVPGYRA